MVEPGERVRGVLVARTADCARAVSLPALCARSCRSVVAGRRHGQGATAALAVPSGSRTCLHEPPDRRTSCAGLPDVLDLVMDLAPARRPLAFGCGARACAPRAGFHHRTSSLSVSANSCVTESAVQLG